MIQLNLRKEEKKVFITIKPVAYPSTAVNSNPLQIQHPPNSPTPSAEQKSLSFRSNIDNLPPSQKDPLPSPSISPEDQKDLYLNRIAESVEGLKRGLTLYRLLERDEEKCRQTVLGWYREAETAFLNCINRVSHSFSGALPE